MQRPSCNARPDSRATTEEVSGERGYVLITINYKNSVERHLVNRAHYGVMQFACLLSASAIGYVARNVQNPGRNAGFRIADEAEARLYPGILATPFADAALDRDSFAAGAELGQGLLRNSKILRMDQVEAAAFRNFILGISENLDSGGTVAAIALQIGKDDYIVGVLGYQFVPGGDFMKPALGIAQALNDY
jgi:hypothetical protein